MTSAAKILHSVRDVSKSQLMSASEIDRTLNRLAYEIIERCGGSANIALVGVRRRGVPLAERIGRAISAIEGTAVPVGTLDITLYGDDLSKVAPQPVLRSKNLGFCVDDRDIVLLDDVLYTGRTVRAAMNGLFDLGRPRGIRLCVLIDRGHRELPIEASFVGRYVQTKSSDIVEVRLAEVDHDERVMLVERLS